MNKNNNTQRTDLQAHLPSVEEIQRHLGTAESIDNFFGKECHFTCDSDP